MGLDLVELWEKMSIIVKIITVLMLGLAARLLPRRLAGTT